MPQFKKYKLGELVTFQRGHDLTINNIVKGKYPVAGSNGPIGYHNKFTTKGPSLTLGRSGNSIGVAHYYENDFWAHNTTLYGKEFHNANPKFIYYLLKTIDFNNHNSGSAVPSLNRNYINPFEVEAPDLPTQTRIASILTSLDDKIEINLRTNHTLEQIAQALFKKYFVDEIDPNNLSKGWRWGKLEEIISVKHGYAFEGKYFSEEATENILLTPGNIKIGGGFNYNKFKYYEGEIPKGYILQKNDLIVTMTDLSKEGDTLGYSAIIPVMNGRKLLHNQRIGKVIIKETDKLKFYLYWLMRTDDYRAFVLGSATGTTVKHTSPTRICEFSCAIPPERILLEFNRVIEGLLEMEMKNQNEIETLAKLRDTLLPKLMSGEIEVNVAEKELADI